MNNIRVTVLKTLKEKSIGLLGAKKAYPVYFETRWGIHTFGMKFPIDVIILDKNNRVVRMKENIKPNSLFIWPPKYKKVIELPAGWIVKHKIKFGDTICCRARYPTLSASEYYAH